MFNQWMLQLADSCFYEMFMGVTSETLLTMDSYIDYVPAPTTSSANNDGNLMGVYVLVSSSKLYGYNPATIVEPTTSS